MDNEKESVAQLLESDPLLAHPMFAGSKELYEAANAQWDDKPSAEIESLIVDALKQWDHMLDDWFVYQQTSSMGTRAEFLVCACLERGLISPKRVNELIREHELFRYRWGALSDEVKDIRGRWFECLDDPDRAAEKSDLEARLATHLDAVRIPDDDPPWVQFPEANTRNGG